MIVRKAALAVALFLMAAADGGAVAAPLGPSAMPPVEASVVEAQGFCARRNFVCRERFGRGRAYQQCMARQGCSVGRARGRRRCDGRAVFCSRRFPGGSPGYRRCLRSGGC